MKILYLLLIIFALPACTYHWQTEETVPVKTYSETDYLSDTSIGRLRRLLLIPIQLETYRTQYNYRGFDLDSRIIYLETETKSYLENSKGYEVVCVRENFNQWDSHFSDRWDYALLNANEGTLIREIGESFNVDGVLVIKAKELRPWDDAEFLMNILLLNAPLFNRIGKPNVGAWIYETSTGKLVWSEEKTPLNTGAVAVIVNSSDLIELFKNLANAIPKILTE